jgi:hypothetical protein
MKKPSPSPLISWAMDLRSTPALNSIRDRHVQAAAVPAAAVDDNLKVGGIKKATFGGVAFFYDGGIHRFRSSAFKGFGIQRSRWFEKLVRRRRAASRIANETNQRPTSNVQR